MTRTQKRDAAIEQIVDIMERSLAKFSPEEQERRLRRMEEIVFKSGRSSAEKAARRVRIRPSRPSRRLRAKR